MKQSVRLARLLEDEGVAMPDVLWNDSYCAWLALRSIEGQRSLKIMQGLALQDVERFVTSYKNWKNKC